MKRAAEPELQRAVQLPDDVWLVIFDYVLGRPRMRNYLGDFSSEDDARLDAYFRLSLVSRDFRRVTGRHVVDWQAMLPRGIEMTRSQARLVAVRESEMRRLRAEIDAIVLREKVSYRSPVLLQLSSGKLSLKKLRRATYPSTAVENRVLQLLRQHERLCRQRGAARKKHGRV